MFMEMRCLVIGGLVCVSWAATAATLDTDPDCHVKSWNPYNPMPGHPTPAERAAFIEKVVPLAKEAEAKYGVPAAALAAMSMAESGYGWTRTSLNANNLFGFKYSQRAAQAGFGKYVLPCQPAWDKGNAYIKFPSYAEAFDAVAKRLSTLSYYAPATKAYAETVPKKKDAVITWVRGIAEKYNCCPDKYVTSLTRIMNNPTAPGNDVSENNLYRLSVAPSDRSFGDLPRETAVPLGCGC
jgi:hypothetical protein